ncbi:MAG TPA: AlkA N-terminal domain-containing protein, partial [Enhygromyxa sp.]|nr:AlkA N-terminal domain-containing protein [Enhygromyxa sp.]
MLSPNECYRALGARDPRFDGLFFVGVVTTGVYCRPICPARTPRADRCQFFGNAAAAEKAGFRACLRCPGPARGGSAPMDARSSLVARALARIDAGFLDEHSVEQLATELGVSSRHLRRALEAELGVGPLELAATRRLALAKQLLHDSALDLTTIAFASGFRSVRRFNAAFAARFERPPSALRRELVGEHEGRPIHLRLDLRPPFCWPAVLEFMRKRAIAGIEHVDAHEYRRLVALDGHVGELSVTYDAARPCLRVELSPTLAPRLARIVARLRRLFDLDAQPAAIDPLLEADPLLAPLVRARPGLRVPGCFDEFEALIRTVLGQQVSLAAARTLSGRLVEQFGEPVPHESSHALDRRFPSPASLAGAAIDSLASIGIPRARATVLRTIASSWTAGTLAPERDDAEATLARLAELPGVGVWTRDSAALRVLQVPDAFPASDGALRREFPELSPKQIEQRAAGWRPFRAYAAQHLWTA